MGKFSNCYSYMQVKMKCGIIYWILEWCRWTVTSIGQIWNVIKETEGTEWKIINTKCWSYRGAIEGIDYNVWNNIWFTKLGAILSLSFILSYSDFFLSTDCRCLLPSIKHTHTLTLVRTPLDEWSGRRRDLYLITHNTQQTSSPRHNSNPQSQQASRRRPTL